jgi:predicted ATPase
VADTLGYLRLSGLPVPEHIRVAADRFRYNPRVFVAPPWPEIFAQDEERRQTLDEAERTYDALAGVSRSWAMIWSSCLWFRSRSGCGSS